MMHNEEISPNCVTWSTEDFIDYSKNINSSNLLIVNQNIRSFNKNSDDFLLFMSRLTRKPDVIILTETWFTEQNVDTINGFCCYHTCRAERVGGGVSIYVREGLNSVKLQVASSVDCDGELCTVRVALGRGKYLYVLGFYRPPGGNVTNFCNQISTSSSKLNFNHFVVGSRDANIDLLNDNQCRRTYLDTLYRASVYLM